MRMNFLKQKNLKRNFCVVVVVFQMSLPGSQRAAGTDGNDFIHRERIAPQYRFSSESKTRFRFLVYSHLLLALIVFSQMLTYHFPILPPNFVIPRPHLWQYIWLISVLASIAGLWSLQKNNVLAMKLFFRGTILFGLGTILITIILNLSELFTFKKLKNNHQLDEVEPQKFFGLPLLVLWYIFLMITVQIHVYSLYIGNMLLGSWQQYKTPKQH